MNFLRSSLCPHVATSTSTGKSTAPGELSPNATVNETTVGLEASEQNVNKKKDTEEEEKKENKADSSDSSDDSTTDEEEDDNEGDDDDSSSDSSSTSVTLSPESRKRRSWLSCCCCLGSCFPSLRFNGNSENKPRETIKLLLLGLDNAGKTTVALHLSGESVEDVVSTIGFSNYELKADTFRPKEATVGVKGKEKKGDSEKGETPQQQPDFRIILYDLGGGSRIRSIWKNYYSLVHGIFFVIDSTDMERMLEVKELMEEVIPHAKVAGKPILIYLNKQDMEDAIDEIDICKFTNLEELVSQYKCITKIEPISARNVPLGRQRNAPPGIDPAMESSFRWLLDFIVDNWAELNGRVEADSEEQMHNEANSLKQRVDRTKAKQQFIEIETQVPTQEHNEEDTESRQPETETTETAKNVPEAYSQPLHGRLPSIDEDSPITSEESKERPATEIGVVASVDGTTDTPPEAIKITENIFITETRNNLKGIMKKTDGGAINGMRQSSVEKLPPMEIIVTQPSSGGSGASSSDSRLSLNLSRSNKVFPS